MKTINQGKPKPNHFTVLQPFPGGSVAVGDLVQCTDPKTKESTTGICIDFWTFSWHELPDSFALLTYGVDSTTLKRAVQKSKPEFQNYGQIRFLLIKETP